MPVIPYTLCDAGLWREFPLHDTLSLVKRSTVVTVAVVIAIIALFFYMSVAKATQECTVCMEFHGRSNCATAAGNTAAEATETAHTTACGPIVSGMNETIACGNRAPLSVQCKGR
jgi:uncharacterized protein (UPF0333 family)